MREQPCVRSHGAAAKGGGSCGEEAGGSPPGRQRRDLGEHVRRGAGNTGTQNGMRGERRTGSALSIQDIGAEASRMSEAVGDGYAPSTRS